MSKESRSLLTYARGAAAIAVLASLVAAVVVFLTGDDPLWGTAGLVLNALFYGGLLMLLRRRCRKKSTAESEPSN